MDYYMKMKVPMVILILVALIGIVSFCSTWAYTGIYVTDLGVQITGIDFIVHGDDIKNGLGIDWQIYIPLIVLILSIVIAIVGALPLLGFEIEPKKFNTIIVILGALMIVSLMVYGNTQINSPFAEQVPEWLKCKLSGIAGTGFLMGYVAGIVTIFVGTLGFIGVFEQYKE